ncbi:MAG: hypothetical protein WBM00_12955 [Solirubrobacterales bacterium]
MFLFRIFFGTLASVLARVAVVAVIALLCYVFLLKPALQTGNDAFKSSGLEQIGKTIGGLSQTIQREVRHSFNFTKMHGGNTQRLVRCIQHAHGSTHRIQRCTRRF